MTNRFAEAMAVREKEKGEKEKDEGADPGQLPFCLKTALHTKTPPINIDEHQSTSNLHQTDIKTSSNVTSNIRWIFDVIVSASGGHQTACGFDVPL